MFSTLTREPFIDKVCQTIKTHGMINQGDHVLMGISGGPDSVALALALSRLRQDFGMTLGLAHVNHLLRGGESDRDQEFVKAFAKGLGLPFHPLKINVASLALEKKRSLEETAREARYTFFTSLCREKGYTRTAVGHTLDDNAELVLMNLLRGSGPRGLAGIPPVRDSWIIRPLIDHSKKEILTFLEEKEQPYVVDSTNLETKFLRNRIRNKLLPLLKQQYNPGITKNLNRVSQIMEEEERWMEKEASAVFSKIIFKASDCEVCLRLSDFNDLALALKRRIARRAVRAVKADLRRITLTHIDAIAALAAANTQGKSLDLPGQIRISKQNQTLCFKKESLPLREIGKAMKRKKHSGKIGKVFLA